MTVLPLDIQHRRIGFGPLARRVLAAAFALWTLTTITFAGLYLSGNPVLRMLGDDATAEDVRLMEEALGFADPVHVQYLHFLGVLLRGEFPVSLQYSQPALDVVIQRLPATALLAVAGVGLGLGLGLLAGLIAAFRPASLTGRLTGGLLSILQAAPPFLVGILLVLLFSVRLRWLPTSGYGSFRHLILPALTIAFLIAPVVGRVFRASLVATAAQPHVIAARARALPEARIRHRHIIANAFLPVITVTGLQLGALLGGTMVVEQVFGWPGIGQLALNAVSYQDYPLVLASTFTMGVAFLLTSLLADVLNRFLDPRGAAA